MAEAMKEQQKNVERAVGGFTLIELLVTISLLALLSACVMPELADCWQQVEMEMVMHQLQKDVRWAQEQARHTSFPMKITWQSDHGRYVVTEKGKATHLRVGKLPKQLYIDKFDHISIETDGTVKSQTIKLQRGGISYEVVFYRTGRCRITKKNM